jgi:4a-hydroxytetrahydrobiopterin dehydratase
MKIKKISEDLNWPTKGGKLYKSFEFKNFKEALDFINQVGQVSEIVNHHPEIRNIYNKVELYIITHDSSKITEKDHNLAEKIDKIYNKL